MTLARIIPTTILRCILAVPLIGLAPLAGPALAADKPVVIKPSHKARIEHNLLIPMRDGKKLSANLVRPDAEGTFPVILEYHPYRKDDLTYGGHDAHHYLAERGFVCVRLDVRGTGGSEGVNTDEYMPVEQRDGYDAIEWLAKQPWSSGRVGMWGTSYGGFTSIQVAMQQPPSLKAIAPMYATDDRYTDDCHYTPGGSMRMYYDVGTYGGTMVAMNAMPPYPEFAGERWAEQWKERLEKNEPYLLTWMKHQVDGPYWRAASLRPGVRPDQVSRLPDRRLARRLCQHDAADLHQANGAQEAADGPVGPSAAQQLRAWPADRLPQRNGPLLCPLLARRRHRLHARAGGHDVPSGVCQARADARRHARLVAS